MMDMKIPSILMTFSSSGVNPIQVSHSFVRLNVCVIDDSNGWCAHLYSMNMKKKVTSRVREMDG